MQVVPLRNENHYKTDFNNFMQLYKSLAASLFKEWEESQKIQRIDEERRLLSEMSFGSILKRDL